MISKAFTLIEMTIVLAIISVLAMATWILWPPIQQKHAETEFFKEFEATYQTTLAKTMLTNRSGFVLFKGHTISFEVKDQPTQKLQVPETLSLVGGQKSMITLAESGMVKPMTVKFRSLMSKKIYIYTIQMGWGRLHVKIT